MSLSDEQAAFLEDFCRLVLFAIGLGFKVTGGELQRMIEQQRHYLATGRSKTLASMHLDKLAGDLNFFKIIPPTNKEVYINALPGAQALEILRPLGEYWESLHPKNVWGGNFDKDWSRDDHWVDVPHFERKA